MQLCTCFLLLKIFALTNTLSQKGRRFNPALETVTIHSNEDDKNLNNRHDFLARATDLEPEVKTFTNFILKAVEILNTYEDTAFEDFFHIFDMEIRKYHYGGCKFFELMQNHNTRRLLVRTLKTIRGNSIIFTKANINEMTNILSDELYDKNVKELLDYINSLYRNNEPEFHTVLNNLKRYTKIKSMKTHKDLEEVIRDGVRTIIFNHYTELDVNTRRELKEKIETFWENNKSYPASNPLIHHSPNTDPVSKSVIDNIKISENMKNKVNEHDNVFKNNLQTTMLDQIKTFVSIDNYDKKSQDKEIEKDASSTESGTTDNIAEEISSAQSFASSSNSIKRSQERYEKYNTQLHMTLYTEEISYKARTTKKTEINPTSEKVMTRRPIFPRRPMTTPRYRPRNVSSNRKKKMKKLRINHDTSDPKQDISPDSSYETENGLTPKLKREPLARVHSAGKQRHAVDMPTVLRSQYDAVIAIQLANNELLKSLKMLAPVGIDTKSDTTLYQKSAGHNKLKPTKHNISASYMRAQEELYLQKPNANSKPTSRYSKRKNNFQSKQPTEPMRSIEPHLNDKELSDEKVSNDQKQMHKSKREHDNTKVKYFNEFVNLKIKTIKNELSELKQVNDVVTRLTNNHNDEADLRNVTDNDDKKYEHDDKRKYMKGNVNELLNSNREINHDELNDEHTYNPRSNTMKTDVSTTNTNTPSMATVGKKDRAVDIVNDATFEATDHNVNITKTDTEERTKLLVPIM